LEAYRQGQMARGAAACERVLQREPRHYWARYLLALCRLGAGEWDRARDGLTACLGERPDFFWSRLFRATAEGGQREFAAAEDDFRAVAPLVDDPLGRWLLHAHRGALRVQEARWDDAISDLKEAVTLRPEAAEGYLTLAQAHAGRSDFVAAVAVLDEAIRHRPDNPELYHTRAQMHLKYGDVKAARTDFEQAVGHGRRTESIPRLVAAVLSPAPPAPARDPRSRAALRLASDYVQLAHLQHEGKDYVAALVSCAAALLVWPDYPPAHYQRAETLQAVKNYAAAGAALDRYLRRAVPTAEVYQARGLIHAQLHEYQKAAEAFDRATALRPDARTLAYCGWAYLKLDAPRPALEKFEAALKVDRTNADALCGRGLIRAWQGDVRGAAADAEIVRHLHPHELDWLIQAACIYAQTAPRAATPEAGADFGNRAVAMLKELMSQLPADRRAAFWRDRVEPEKELNPVRRSRAYLDLARTYGGS
jgi:tetratricopeptide (TPR) repeat protein